MTVAAIGGSLPVLATPSIGRITVFSLLPAGFYGCAVIRKNIHNSLKENSFRPVSRVGMLQTAIVAGIELPSVRQPDRNYEAKTQNG